MGPPETIDAGIAKVVGTQPDAVDCVPAGQPAPMLVYGQVGAELGHVAKGAEFELDA